MLCDHLEAIVVGNTNAVQQRLVDDLANLRAIFRRLAFEKIDSNKGHLFLLNCGEELYFIPIDARADHYGAVLWRPMAGVLHFKIRRRVLPITGNPIRTCFSPRNMWAT